MSAYSELRLLARQLSIQDAMRVAGSEVARRLLDRHKTFSYAQNGEDLIIDNILGLRSPGRYVDVGCNHPIQWSNTYRLYLSGWTGLAIDANPAYAAAFRASRPRDQFINACVSDKVGDATLRIYRDPFLTSLTEHKVFDSPSQYAIETTQTVHTRTLDEILAASNFAPQFDLLSIDVEFHDQGKHTLSTAVHSS
jgi:FkbM family methyltransferase